MVAKFSPFLPAARSAGGTKKGNTSVLQTSVLQTLSALWQNLARRNALRKRARARRAPIRTAARGSTDYVVCGSMESLRVRARARSMDAVTLSDEGCRFCGESSLSSHNVGSACLRTPSCTQAHSDVPPYSPTAAQGSRNRRPGQCCFLNFGGRIATAGLFTNVVRDNSQIVCGTCYSHGDKTLKELKERRQEALAKPPAGATRGAAQRGELVLLDLNVLAGAPARGGGEASSARRGRPGVMWRRRGRQQETARSCYRRSNQPREHRRGRRRQRGRHGRRERRGEWRWR